MPLCRGRGRLSRGRNRGVYVYQRGATRLHRRVVRLRLISVGQGEVNSSFLDVPKNRRAEVAALAAGASGRRSW